MNLECITSCGGVNYKTVYDTQNTQVNAFSEPVHFPGTKSECGSFGCCILVVLEAMSFQVCVFENLSFLHSANVYHIFSHKVCAERMMRGAEWFPTLGNEP